MLLGNVPLGLGLIPSTCMCLIGILFGVFANDTKRLAPHKAWMMAILVYMTYSVAYQDITR